MDKAMNTLKKWLLQPVVITFAAGMVAPIRGKLVEVDEQWLTVEQPAEGIAVVAVLSVVCVSLDAK
jgi:hypothetical protein